MQKGKMIYHADDYGACREVSEHILDCYREGALTSMSILPNSPCLDSCMERLARLREQDVLHFETLSTSIHFNLAEGHCLADPAHVSLLVDERGMFSISFFKALFFSFTGKRRELQRQIKTELQAQLECMLPYIDTLRIDSHQHYHMIPVVLKTILECVRELPHTQAGARWLADSSEHCAEIEFIRIPAEPVSPFLMHPELWSTLRPINLVKNLVLNVLNLMDVRLLKPYRKRSAVFFGIMLSGRMDLKRVRRLLPEFKRIADKKHLPLEILCHPGGASHPEVLMDTENADCVRFYTSEGRIAEKEMMFRIKKEII